VAKNGYFACASIAQGEWFLVGLEANTLLLRASSVVCMYIKTGMCLTQGMRYGNLCS